MALNRLSKRRQRIVITLLLSSVVLLVAVIFVWMALDRTDPYRAGEEIDGITADLSRTLPERYPDVHFVDVTAEAGIRFRHFPGTRSSQLPEDMGSGAAWGDYNNDGWVDLLVVNLAGPLTLSGEMLRRGAPGCVLYRNNGDGTFRDVTTEAGLQFRGWGMAAAWGDYDGDGRLDLFISCYGENVFYRNEGDGTFRDVTAASGLGGKTGFWAGAAWMDYNGDQRLDLYVCGYVRYRYEENAGLQRQFDLEVPVNINPSAFPPEENLLYRNDGNGRFSEVAREAGVANGQGRSLSAAWCDFDEDGWPDLYVANDVSDNSLFHNLGNGKFRDISHPALVADYRGAMGIAVGDWDGDEDMDMFITHWIAQENALFNNLRSQARAAHIENATTVMFMDEADRYGLGQIALDYIGWGTSFFDYDNDSRLDLFVVNGSTFQQKENPVLLEAMPSQLFWNSGSDKGFYDVSPVSGEVFSEAKVGRGAALADYDHDGDLDLFIVNHGGHARLLRNEGGNRNNWLAVRLSSPRGNRFAVGARLRLVAGNRAQIREVGAQSSYLSQNSMTAHFGLGEVPMVDTLVIRWPGGLRERWLNIAPNQLLHVVKGEHTP